MKPKKNKKRSRHVSHEKTNRRKKRLTEAEKVYLTRHSAYERVSIVLFMAIFFFTGLCLVFLRRPDYSVVEKRELAKMPELTLESYLSGSFAKDFTSYFSDTVPFREQIVSISASFNAAKGVKAPKFYGNVSVVADDDGRGLEDTDTMPAQTEPAQTVQTIKTDEGELDVIMPAVTEPQSPEVTDIPEETAPAEPAPEAEEEEFKGDISEFSNNGIIVDSVKMYGGNAGVMLFGGNKKMGTRYAELISRYKEAMGEEVNVYNIVVPTSVEFYLPKKFRKYSSSEKDAIEHIYNSYTADIIPVDAYSEIAAHTDEYIYLRTDHHWSHRGAYYAYAALCKAMGETPPDIDTDYEVREIDGYVGSLYGYTNDPILKNSPELFTYYKPTKTEYKTYYYDYETLEPKGEGRLFYDNVSTGFAYGVFIGSDAVHTQIITENTTGRKVCVFKESYGNAFVPYLVDSFDEIYVIDIRYFGRNAVEYMKEKGITDVIFINNAFAANTSSLIDGIEHLYTNQYGTLQQVAPEAEQQVEPAATNAAAPTAPVEQQQAAPEAETAVTAAPPVVETEPATAAPVEPVAQAEPAVAPVEPAGGGG